MVLNHRGKVKWNKFPIKHRGGKDNGHTTMFRIEIWSGHWLYAMNANIMKSTGKEGIVELQAFTLADRANQVNALTLPKLTLNWYL